MGEMSILKGNIMSGIHYKGFLEYTAEIEQYDK